MTEPFSEMHTRVEATPVGQEFTAAGFRLEARGGALGWHRAGDPEIRVYDASSGCGMTEDGSDVWSVMIFDGAELIETVERAGITAALEEARRWL